MSFPVHKSLKGRRAVVLGSGIAGLSAAISLAVRGAKVLVLEPGDEHAPQLLPRSLHHSAFPPWPPTYSSPQVLAELFASAGLRLTDFVTLGRRRLLARFLDTQGAAPWDLPADPSERAASLETMPGETARALHGLFAQAESAYRDWDLLRRRQAPRTRWELLQPVRLRHEAQRWQRRSLGEQIERLVTDPFVRRCLLGLRVLSGCPPYQSRRLALGWLGEWLSHGGWTMEGGGEALRTGLLRVAQISGVRLAFGAQVERIELRGGQVRQLIGSGFKPLKTSLVVSTLPARQTLVELLPRSPEQRALLERLRARPELASQLIFRVATTRRWSQVLMPLTLIPADKPRYETRFLDRWGVMPLPPSLAVADWSAQELGRAPREGGGLLAIRALAPPPGKLYKFSEERRADWEERLIARLEAAGVEKLGSSLWETELLAPEDLAAQPDYTLAERWWAAPPHSGALGQMAPNRVDFVPGLYLAGPGAHPGSSPANEALAGMLSALAAAEDGRNS